MFTSTTYVLKMISLDFREANRLYQEYTITVTELFFGATLTFCFHFFLEDIRFIIFILISLFWYSNSERYCGTA